MSRRTTIAQSTQSKNLKPSRLKQGQLARFNSKESSKQQKNQMIPISHSAKRNAYDRIKKIQAIEREKASILPFQELLKEVKNLLKDDIQISTVSIFPGESKSEIGRAILIDGTFFVVFVKIMFRSQLIVKKSYLQILRKKFLPNVTQNRAALTYYLEDEEQKIQKQEKEKIEAWIEEEKKRIASKNQSLNKEQESKQDKEEKSQQTSQKKIQNEELLMQWKKFRDFATMTSEKKQQLMRKSCLKSFDGQSSRKQPKNVKWKQILTNTDSQYLKTVIYANIEQEKKQNKQDQEQKKLKVTAIRKSQSFLIDFFQINEIFDIKMVDLVGVIDEINGKYAIMLIKEKICSPLQSYVKTRNSYSLDNQRKKQQKQKKQMIAIGLIKKMECHEHNSYELKEIQKNYPDIQAYVQIDDPKNFFLASLQQDESLSSINDKK